ncbi:MAG: thioredoxin family protein [Bdellovibrionales bacterium]|nr:thioredoxin family protein [Bdellovibrionales bacterium]
MTHTPGRTHDVTLEIFDQITDQHPLIILDFWAAWCQPCKVFAEPFALMAELHPEIYFGKVNVDIAKDLAEAFQVKSIPTLIAFKNGDIVYEQPGIPPSELFEKLVQHLLS